VSDGGDTGKLGQLLSHGIGQSAHAPNGARLPIRVDRDDTDGFLTTMLQRVQAEQRDLWRVDVSPNTEYSAHWL
jgi:hypothetical protein